jgi:hypothetical protein
VEEKKRRERKGLTRVLIPRGKNVAMRSLGHGLGCRFVLLLAVASVHPFLPLGRPARTQQSPARCSDPSFFCQAAEHGECVTKSSCTVMTVLRGLRGGDDSSRARCMGCSQEAAKRVVNKAGANKGRSFFCCARPSSAACRSFFKWADMPARGAGSAAQPPRPASPNITVVNRVLSQSGGVTLRDSAGVLLAVSPHPHSVMPTCPPDSCAPRVCTPGAASGNASVLNGGGERAPGVDQGQYEPHTQQPAGRAGDAEASPAGECFLGFKMASGTPLRVPSLPRTSLLSPPVAATLPGVPTDLHAHPPFAAAGAASTLGGGIWSSRTFGPAAFSPLCRGYKNDPRTEPTVGLGTARGRNAHGDVAGSGGCERGGASLRESGGMASLESATMPGERWCWDDGGGQFLV